MPRPKGRMIDACDIRRTDRNRALRLSHGQRNRDRDALLRRDSVQEARIVISPFRVAPAKPRKLYPAHLADPFKVMPTGKIVSIKDALGDLLELTIVRDGRRYRAVVRVISVEEE